jgi:hypothetical protein
MNDTPSTDDLRAVVVAVLDKLAQVERLLLALRPGPDVDDILASVRAWRAIARSYLVRLRRIDGGEGCDLAASEGTPTGRAARDDYGHASQTRDRKIGGHHAEK